MTRVLDIDDVLALVEERPMTSGELAELLELPADVVHRCLLAAGRAGTLKRVGTDRAWALPSVVAPSGAPRSVLRDRVDAAILDALAVAPLSSEQLIARLPHSKRTIPEQCAALEAAGRIRRVGHGIKTRWVRVDADASVLAQLPADMKARVLEVLQAGPMGCAAIAAAVGLRQKGSVRRYVLALEQTGQVKTVSVNGRTRRALASWQPPATSGSSTSNEAPKPEGDAIEPDEVVDDVEDIDDAIASVLEQAPRSVRAKNARGQQLRHAHERPASVTVASELPWWTTAARDGFTAAAGEQLERMRASKEALKVGLRLLQ